MCDTETKTTCRYQCAAEYNEPIEIRFSEGPHEGPCSRRSDESRDCYEHENRTWKNTQYNNSGIMLFSHPAVLRISLPGIWTQYKQA